MVQGVPRGSTPVEGRGWERKGTGAAWEGKLDCNTCQQRWALQLSQVGLVFLSCIRSVIGYGLPLEGAVTLSETVIVNQNHPQRGLTAETYQLTTSPVIRGVSFLFPKRNLVAHHRVPVHWLPKGLPALLCIQSRRLLDSLDILSLLIQMMI